ncbi:putative ribonucleoside-diphosphate reductase small chain B [Earliella scabrosa]|nr:putative ribonucleoside-diphosphate reductase small chain B [Earliella scabrosa]
MSATNTFLQPDASRFVLFPIRYPKLWAAYKTAHQCIWTAGEIDFTKDRVQWNAALSEEERQFLSIILAFFAASDGIVVENLVQRFCNEVATPEARCFYGIQMMMENIHAEVYSRAVQELVGDKNEQDRLFHGFQNMPVVKAKADWCLRWIDDAEKTFSTRLIAFAIVEGVFFSSSFAAIFWLRQRGLMPGLVQANAMIARDEGLHVSFACLLYEHVQMPVDSALIYAMIAEAVDLEHAFFEAALPRPLIGMNSTLMRQYVEYVADFLLKQLGVPPLYNALNPFAFMQTIIVERRTNFFERPVSDYLGIPVPRVADDI